MSHTTDTRCALSVSETGGGTISSSGSYVAPSTAGAYHVIATSVASPTTTASATVIVPETISGCSALASAPVGTWQNITPPAIDFEDWCAPQFNADPNAPDYCPDPGHADHGLIGTYGANAFVIDPLHTNTVYLGTSSLGIWKSTDCGSPSSWVHINTGENGAALDTGRNWTMAIDFANPQVLYTVAGYNPDAGGIFKSSDGGINWKQVLTPDVFQAGESFIGGFMEKVTIDPTNNLHLLASFHQPCLDSPQDGGHWGCLAESKDAGMTWSLTTSPQEWNEGDGQTMINENLWFFGDNFGGIWRTTTGGRAESGHAAWEQVVKNEGLGSVYVASDGSYYAGGLGSTGYTLHSADGTVDSWKSLDGSPAMTSMNGSTPMVQVGDTMYFGSGSVGNYAKAATTTGWYWTAPVASPNTITKVSVSSMHLGGAYMDFDPVNHLVYSSNMTGGFWRMLAQ